MGLGGNKRYDLYVFWSWSVRKYIAGEGVSAELSDECCDGHVLGLDDFARLPVYPQSD